MLIIQGRNKGLTWILESNNRVLFTLVYTHPPITWERLRGGSHSAENRWMAHGPFITVNSCGREFQPWRPGFLYTSVLSGDCPNLSTHWRRATLYLDGRHRLGDIYICWNLICNSLFNLTSNLLSNIICPRTSGGLDPRSKTMALLCKVDFVFKTSSTSFISSYTISDLLQN
jgi:hypothetical protein